MNVREWLNNNSAVVTIVAVLVLCFALAFIIWQNSPGGQTGPIDVYYVDLNSGELFTATSDQYPPIAAPSDSEGERNGVRVHLYSCDECPSDLVGRSLDELENDGVYVGYLERYTEEAREAMEEGISGDGPEDEMRYYELMETGQEVAGPDGEEWMSPNSERGHRIVSQHGERCSGDERPDICRP